MPPKYGSPYPSNVCINCRKPFCGAFCEDCGHHSREEVVSHAVLTDALRTFAAAQRGTKALAKGQDNPVLLAFDDRCREHMEEPTPGSQVNRGRGHPERPERVEAIMARLYTAGLLQRLLATPGRTATDAELLAVHDPLLLAEVQRASEALKRAARRAAAGAANGVGFGGMGIDLEALDATNSPQIRGCYINASTAACARLAAGSAADVACRVLSGAARHGAAIIRPPGHHAESSLAMGFCYINNAAVAARAAQAAGAERVLIMDWDVHHGNGTQAIFYNDPTVLYMSTHRYDGGRFFPGSGAATEVGSGAGTGFTVNVPWSGPGVRDADMLAAFRLLIVPVAAEFRPDLVIVSAGFDAVEGDPLGGCRVTPAAFGHLTALLAALGPTVLLLEGGYNLTATAAATEACVRVLLGEAPAPLPLECAHGMPASAGAAQASAAAAGELWVSSGLEGVSGAALEALRLALRAQAYHWESARAQAAAVEAAVQERQRGSVAGAGVAASP